MSLHGGCSEGDSLSGASTAEQTRETTTSDEDELVDQIAPSEGAAPSQGAAEPNTSFEDAEREAPAPGDFAGDSGRVPTIGPYLWSLGSPLVALLSIAIGLLVVFSFLTFMLLGPITYFERRSPIALLRRLIEFLRRKPFGTVALAIGGILLIALFISVTVLPAWLISTEVTTRVALGAFGPQLLSVVYPERSQPLSRDGLWPGWSDAHGDGAHDRGEFWGWSGECLGHGQRRGARVCACNRADFTERGRCCFLLYPLRPYSPLMNDAEDRCGLWFSD